MEHWPEMGKKAKILAPIFHATLRYLKYILPSWEFFVQS